MNIDLSTLNLRELDTLIRAARGRHKALTERAPAENVKCMLVAEARQAGYTIEELFGPDAGMAQPERKARSKQRKRGKVAPKRSPSFSSPTVSPASFEADSVTRAMRTMPPSACWWSMAPRSASPVMSYAARST